MQRPGTHTSSLAPVYRRRARWIAALASMLGTFSVATAGVVPATPVVTGGDRPAPLAVRAPTEVADEGSEDTVVEHPSSTRGMQKLFPLQFAAREIAGDPASHGWALLIGIDDYIAPTEDLAGSVHDALALRAHLLSRGWRSDHILVLEDRAATAGHILGGIRWLASRTSRRSKAIFHFAGHEMVRHADRDGDAEPFDVELWGADNRFVLDSVLGRELGRVRASRMWITFGTCRAGGFDDPGMRKPGRVITYSSAESELSYEAPRERHSVFGYYMLGYGMARGHADRNRDGRVSVEEAFGWARPYVVASTGGLQHPQITDRAPGMFYLDFPAGRQIRAVV